MVGWEKKKDAKVSQICLASDWVVRWCIIFGDAHPTFHGRHGIQLYGIGNMGENGGKEKVRESGFIG